MSKSRVIPKPVSAAKLRLGVVLIALWWIPVYLAVPVLIKALGDSGNPHAVKIFTAWVILIQTVIGLAGLALLGKELSQALRGMPLKKMPITFWRIIWTGHVDSSTDRPSA
jgi:hypothetical protein